MTAQIHNTMALDFVTLDVFTSTPYEGNPLTIVKIPLYLQDRLSQAQKQRITYEFNLSETIFLHEKIPGANEWAVDIFTNTDELLFAGHPTIGSAYYILQLNYTAPNPRSRTLLTKAGAIKISETSNGGVVATVPYNVRIHKHTISNLVDPSIGLSTSPLIFEREKNAPIVSIIKGMTFLLVRLPSLEVLRAVVSVPRQINFYQILDKGWEEGFVATYYYVLRRYERDGRINIRTRMIEATMEDPATGSAACALGSYLALTGVGLDLSSQVGSYQIVQGVEIGRKSVMEVSVTLKEEVTGRSSAEIKSVILSGSAVRVMEGKLWVRD